MCRMKTNKKKTKTKTAKTSTQPAKKPPKRAWSQFWRKRTCSQHPTRGWPFSASRCEKKTGNVDLKMGPKIWTPFWGAAKGKTIRRTPKQGPDFAPHFRVHIAHVFRTVTPENVLALGRTELRGLVFGALFSPHFGVQRKWFFSKETMLKPVWPKSDTIQAQQKLRSNLAQHN